MRSDDPKITTIYISKKMKDHIKNNPKIKSLGEWTEKKYSEEFMSIDKEKREEERLTEEIKACRLRIQRIEDEDSFEVPEKISLWIREEAILRLQKPGVDPHTILRAMNNECGTKVSMKQFRIYLAKEKSEDPKLNEPKKMQTTKEAKWEEIKETLKAKREAVSGTNKQSKSKNSKVSKAVKGSHSKDNRRF